MPPSQKYSNKNNWGYWTGKKENQGQYRCDTCLIEMYRNHKHIYLSSITDGKIRRTFRAYFGGKNILITKFQQKQIKIRGLHDLLRSKGIDQEPLSTHFLNWLPTPWACLPLANILPAILFFPKGILYYRYLMIVLNNLFFAY